MNARAMAAVFCFVFSMAAPAQAGAFTVHMTSDYTGDTLAVGSTINIQMHLDAPEIYLQEVSLNLLFDPIIFRYNPQMNAAVGVKTYILYFSTMSPGHSGLYPSQDPWEYWPTPPPGLQQVNVTWASSSDGTSTRRTGMGDKIAEIQLVVAAEGDGLGEILLTTTAGGGAFTVQHDPDATLQINGSPINVVTPEPYSALLLGLGLVGLGVARRRR